MAVLNRLNEWMDEKGWTQQQTADATGIHITTIRRVQKNQGRGVETETMAAICKTFGKSVSEFWYDTEEK